MACTHWFSKFFFVFLLIIAINIHAKKFVSWFLENFFWHWIESKFEFIKWKCKIRMIVVHAAGIFLDGVGRVLVWECCMRIAVVCACQPFSCGCVVCACQPLSCGCVGALQKIVCFLLRILVPCPADRYVLLQKSSSSILDDWGYCDWTGLRASCAGG